MGELSGGTLVVCPMSLVAQWEEHVREMSARYTSPYLPISPYISLYLPVSPYISL